MLHRSGAGTLPAHLETTYGTPVVSARELDLGVHRIERADGSTWVARVFPFVRPIEGTRQDAATLKWLIEAGFPAERCAHEEPVSVHDGQSVLVTQFVAGRNPAANPATFELLGQLLGQLHALQPRSASALQPGGAWHHLVLDCGPEEEIAAAAALLHDARHRVPPGQGARCDALVRAVSELDDCRELPKAFIHADPVPRNLIRSADGTVTVVDWAGAGWGPRVLSVGCLLWSAASKGPASVRAAATGYRSVAGRLSPRELELLTGTMKTRPLILACWTFATGRGRLEDVIRRWQRESRAIEAGARLAAQVFSGDR